LHPDSTSAYSEDLRKKTVEAKERGVLIVEVVLKSGDDLSWVERHAKTTRGLA